MIKRVLIFLAVVAYIPLAAQDVQWASSLLEFSSELSPKEYSAEQVIGKPNVLPVGGDSPNAWLPSSPNKDEYIKVGFERPTRVQQIAIGESYNPSAVYQLFLYDEDGNEYLVNTFTPRPIELRGRLLNVFIDQTPYEVHALKLTLRGIEVPGYNGIDAIGITNSREPVVIEVELAENVSENIATERLDENINSEYQEMRPLLAPDGQTLYFSRRNHPENIGGTEDPEDIWFAEYDEQTGEWFEAENLGAPLNNADANFISSVTPDGNAMTVILGNRYEKNENMTPGVSLSTKSSTGWSKPQQLDITNAFIENNDGDYFIAQDRKTLIMAVERFDSYGRKDIYVSFQMQNGNWTEPLNLGNDINTADTESSPFLAADGETLYFSSQGYSGFGKSDIYISRRLDDTWQNWTTPENLGSDLNSAEDDVFFNIPPSGKYAYYSKSRTEFDADIYRIELPIFFQPAPVVTMKGKLVNAETMEPVAARISYELLPEKTDIGYTLSDSVTGEYEIVLPVGATYRYVVDVDGFTLMEDTVNLLNREDYTEIEKDIFIDPQKMEQLLALQQTDNITEDEPDDADYFIVDGERYERVKDAIEINEGVLSVRVQFDFDSYQIKKNSYPDLDRIINLLKNTPVDIIVAGHTCNIGEENYNQYLSKKRAQAVYDYLVDKGVDPEKLFVNGYGEDRPLYPNETMSGRIKNRRVEFIRKDQYLLYDLKYQDEGEE